MVRDVVAVLVTDTCGASCLIYGWIHVLGLHSTVAGVILTIVVASAHQGDAL